MKTIRSSYLPYGGYELKAKYQRNLMTAIILVVSLTAGLVVSGHILLLSGPEQAGATVLDDKTFTRGSTPTAPPTIIRDPSGLPDRKGAQPSVDLEGTKPVPVPDNLAPDEGIALPTREEISASIGSAMAGDASDMAGPAGAFIQDAMTDYIPPPDSFVKCETYPELIYVHTPQYPDLAEKAGVTGNVCIKALVNEEGNVIDVIVAKSSESALLDDSARMAAYRNKFKPAIQNGRPIKLWVTYKVCFKLDD
ncbi:MAG: energy transducer TonB [Candidatus Zixiibacteriota bacterium]|nr:MAG: energy transducer TonB [candidate division Zixibacteria bacterium]